MNADRLLAHYERIADAPDAVPRLRRFILDVAVRGKLVEQDPNDKPASELLKRIVAEMAERVKRQKSLPDFESDQLGDVPRNWYAVPLIAVGQWAIGSGFPKDEQGRSDGPHFFLKVSDMNLPENKKYITAANNCIDGDAAKRMKAAIHPAGTIIFPKIGGAIATNKRRILTRGSAIDNNCLGIIFSSHINIEWAYLLMTHLDFTRYQAGTAVPALQQGTLATIPVALPPLAEQYRIVAKVDELMALCDRQEKARAEREATRDRLTASSLARLDVPDPDPMVFRNHAAFALEHLTPLTTRRDQIKALRQTILNLAVRGKLVAQDPNDEPAAELLRRIAKEKARLVKAKKIRAPRQVPVIDAGECSFDTPRGWEWKRLSEISRKIHYGLTASANNMIDVVRLLRITDIHKNSVDWVSVPGCEIDEKAIPQFKLEKGDILVARTGGTIGKSFLVQDVPAVVVFASYLIRVQGSHEMYDRYLKLFFESPTYWIQLQDGSKGTGQPNVNGQTLGKMLVPVPPLAEQQRIVAKVDELIALCDRLAASLATGDDTRCRLLGALLTEALECGESYVSEQAERATAHG